MTKFAKGICCIIVPFGILFCLVGYAALSSTLSVQGSAELDMPKVVYISEIKEIDYSDGAQATAEGDFSGVPIVADFPSTKFLSNITFAKNSYVTITVTIVNNTSTSRIFNRLKDYEDSGDYTYTGINSDYNSPNPTVTPGQGTVIPANGSLDFTVTIQNTGNSTVENFMLYEFEFVADSSELTQGASLPVLDKYEALINNSDEYEKLVEKMKWGAGTGKQGYISNCEDYNQEAKDAVNEAFDGVLQMEIDGEICNITVLLKHQSVCKWNDTYKDEWWGGQTLVKETEERIIFFTADPLNEEGATVPVFASVFYEEDGVWIPAGQRHMDTENGQKYWILEGTATVCDVNGDSGTGNFQTGHWVSTKEYFGVSAGADLTDLMDQCKPE